MLIRQHYEYQHTDGTRVEGVMVDRLNGGMTSNFIGYRIGSVLIDCGPSNQWWYVKTLLETGPSIEQLWLRHHH